MTRWRVLYQLMRADYLERVRRHAFVVMLGLTGVTLTYTVAWTLATKGIRRSLRRAAVAGHIACMSRRRPKRVRHWRRAWRASCARSPIPSAPTARRRCRCAPRRTVSAKISDGVLRARIMRHRGIPLPRTNAPVE